MNRNEQITEARARLEELTAKEQERQESTRRAAFPAREMADAQAELERLERLEREETARAQLRGIAAGVRAHKTALEVAVTGGCAQLSRILGQMDSHLEGIRENRKKFFETAETLSPGITREPVPGSPASQESHARAQALLSELRRAGIDLDAALESSTGRLSPHDSWRPLPTSPDSELGAGLWQIFLETKKPANPRELARPLKTR